MAGIGDYKKGKAFELRSGKTPAFKMLGSSPMKQVNIQTGFGPEADANLKSKVNSKVKPVVKKPVPIGAANSLWKGTKKLLKPLAKLAWPLTLADGVLNAPSLGEKHGLKKFVGGMIWDKDLFLTDKQSKETWDGGNKYYKPRTPNKDSETARRQADKPGDLYNYKSLR